MLKRAFTLIELLVVIAIIAILAAILFPVFAQAKTAAQSTVWLNSFKQTAISTQLYTTDYDDGVPFVNSGGEGIPGWGFGRPDYVWYELVQPYIKNWELSACPADPLKWRDRALDPVTERPLPPGHPNFYYAIASRANIGYNFYFMSPWVVIGRYVGSRPINQSLVASPSNTLMQVDSIWDRNITSGVPFGGGNWVVQAPCLLDENGQTLEPMKGWRDAGQWRAYTPPGWDVGRRSWLEFGGMWPWYSKKFRVAMFDSSVKTMSLGQLSAGCNVVRGARGLAFDGDAYIWDLR